LRLFYTNRRVESSDTTWRSRWGWKSKSQSEWVLWTGEWAQRNRPRSLLAWVASTSSSKSRSGTWVADSFSLVARSSSWLS
jgi:hypothetical protein